MLDTLPVETAPNTQQVLTFHIEGFKTERDGKKLSLPAADDVYAHNGPGTMSSTIDQILTAHGLTHADIISITSHKPDNISHHSVGSWMFWMFCRNPKAAKTNG